MAAKAAWVTRVLGVAVPSHADDIPHLADDDHEHVRLDKCIMIWKRTVEKIQAQARALKAAMIVEVQASGAYDDDEIAEIESRLDDVEDMVAVIDSPIMVDLVSAVINTEPGPARAAAQRAVIAKVDELERIAESDEDFALIDSNEYMATNVKAMATAALETIRKEMQMA
jgi:hypothetical protein